MGLKYSLLATEGLHDQAVICRLLRLLGLKPFNGERKLLDETLYKFWIRLFPRASTESNMYERLDMQIPRIFTSETHSVAVYQGGGSNLTQNLIDRLVSYPAYVRDIHAFGLIVDADNRESTVVAKEYAGKLRRFFPMISGIPGSIALETPRTGIYVLPDNKRQGTLDSMLVDCASVVYPDHKAGAIQFLDGLDSSYKNHWKPFDREKAVVASIVSVIQPGIASHLSLTRARDKWICEETVENVSEVSQLNAFISELLELSISQLEGIV